MAPCLFVPFIGRIVLYNLGISKNQIILGGKAYVFDCCAFVADYDSRGAGAD